MSSTYKAIAIGTSAGGLFALSYLLEALPADFPLPVIVVQHRVKDQGELLEELLQSKCRIRVKQADEKEKIESCTVYFAPPGYHLLVEPDGTFSLAVDDPGRFSTPSIDVLFETAAIVFRNRLTGVILTGANDDGANGIIAVNKYGGTTIAQDPDEADYPIMPKAAIATKSIRYTWTLDRIRDYLLEISETQSYNENEC